MHEVETLAYVNALPWHGLGVDLNGYEGALLGDAMRAAAGLDWTVSKRPVLYVTADGRSVEDRTHRALVRDSDERVLGIVGPDYHPIQNADCFTIPDDLVERGLLTYEVAGSLRNGKIVFALAKMGETVIKRRSEWNARYGTEGDAISNYVLWTTRHDGFGGRVAGTTRIRVVCKNTYDAAYAAGFGDRIHVQHRRNAQTRMQQADAFLRARILSEEAFAAAAQELADSRLGIDGFRSVASDFLDEYKGVLAEEPRGTDEKDLALFARQVEKRSNQINELVDFFGAGTGNVGADKLDGYNALTEWLDHQRKRYEKATAKSRESFFSKTVLGGVNFKAKGRALALLRKA